MKVSGVWCFKCKTFNYSRAVHDFHSCPCGNVYVDGGRDYLKISFKDENQFCTDTIEIDATEKQLISDWNRNEIKYGVVEWDGTEEEFTVIKAKFMLSLQQTLQK